MNPYYVTMCHQDDRARWLLARRCGWGASEAGKLMRSKKSFERALRDKTSDELPDLEGMARGVIGGLPPECTSVPPEVAAKHAGLLSIARGRLMEPWIVQAYGSKRGVPVAEWGSMLRSLRTPALCATPDAMQYCEGEFGVVEVKCVSTIDGFRTQERILQVQQQLWVSGFQRGTLVALELGRDYDMLLDDESDEQLLARAKKGKIEWLDIEMTEATMLGVAGVAERAQARVEQILPHTQEVAPDGADSAETTAELARHMLALAANGSGHGAELLRQTAEQYSLSEDHLALLDAIAKTATLLPTHSRHP